MYGVRKFPMLFRLLKLGVIMAVFVWLSGCPAPVYQKKTPTPEPKISEEDISEGQTSQPKTEEQPSTMNVPPAPPVEPGPPIVDPGSQPRRKIRWKGSQGSTRGWELSNEGSSSKEP
jgi:hypothetical protein